MTENAREGRRLRFALPGAYATNFGALAASSPFLAVHLGNVGFSAPAVAQLLALLLLVRVVTLPVWTLLADRAGAIGGVLGVASAGALVSFAALFLDPRPVLVAATLVAFAVFRAPFGALLDALLLRDAKDPGAAFGAVRAWGTAGYALAALATGALVGLAGSRAMIYVTTLLLAAALASAWAIAGKGGALPGGVRPPPGGTQASGGGLALLGRLLRRPRVLLLMSVALLQEMGLAPYDALFPAYLTKLAGAPAAGVAVTVGAAAEFLFLLGSAALLRRLGPERLLAVACAASTARWASIALITNPAALVAIQVSHALSFGAFYLSSVILVDRETPPDLRASGQGLFGSFAFGIAAALGLSLAGIIERRGGVPAVFAFATLASLLATFAAALLRPRGETTLARAL